MSDHSKPPYSAGNRVFSSAPAVWLELAPLHGSAGHQPPSDAEKRWMEAEMRQSQRFELLGKLAAGIAHDFNNLLHPIIAVALAVKAQPAQPELGENMEKILLAARRGKDLAHQILTFSRCRHIERKPVYLSPILQEALDLLRPVLPPNIELVADLRPEIGTVVADPSQIHQVLLNLCANAVQAIRPNSGRVTVRLDSVAKDSRIHLPPALRAGPHVRLSVIDTGSGIDEATLPRIFQPFFTTRGPEGNGLGLTIVQSIIQDHDGLVEATSAPGQGSTFNVFLPLAELPA